MLQIISGKFFESDDRHVFEGKGIIYSNYSWVETINTGVASIEPVDIGGSSATSYVISYTNQIEKTSSPLVRTGDSQIVEQFKLLCIFGLRAFFNVDRNEVELNCRDKRKHSGDEYIPSKFIKRFFDPIINGTQEEVENFGKFVNKVISLPRQKYLSIINSLNNFCNAMQALNYNIDLAYSMLVYSIEALSLTFYSFKPTWQDYDQNMKDKLQTEFANIDSSAVERIKNILIESSHLKLQKRFIDFVVTYTSDSFYSTEAKDIIGALKKSETIRALKNAYNMRSKYVHQLMPIQEQLRFPNLSDGDVVRWQNDVYFTFSGLTRLVYHVITNFIWTQESVEKEKYNWYQDLPGIISVEMAPQYWIWEHEHFTPKQALKRLSGLLSKLEDSIINNAPMVDLTGLMKKIEEFIPNAKSEDKLPMVAMYIIYNGLFFKDSLEKIWDKYNKELSVCTIESLVVYHIVGGNIPWNVDDCENIYNDYVKQKFSKNNLLIPNLFNIGLMLQLATMNLELGNTSRFQEWLCRAYLDSPGKPKLQDLLLKHKNNNEPLNTNDIISVLRVNQ